MPEPLKTTECRGKKISRICDVFCRRRIYHQDIEAELLKRARAGETAAFAELYRRFGRAVFHLAYRILGRREAADEVVKDSFLRLMKHIDAFRGDAPFGLWLRQIAVRASLA